MTQPTGLRLQAASALIRDQTPTGAFNTRQDVPWTAEMHGLSRLPALCGIRIIMELHRRASASDHGRGPRINCHSRFPAYRISNCKPRASSPHLIRALPISDPDVLVLAPFPPPLYNMYVCMYIVYIYLFLYLINLFIYLHTYVFICTCVCACVK